MWIFLNYKFVKFWTEKEIDQAPNSNTSSVDEENSDGEEPGVRTTGKSDKKNTSVLKIWKKYNAGSSS